jgi:hypothetical protein
MLAPRPRGERVPAPPLPEQPSHPDLASKVAVVTGGSRTRAKNEIHAALIRRLQGRPPVSDLFGAAGRAWLGELVLPEDETETIAGCGRSTSRWRDRRA